MAWAHAVAQVKSYGLYSHWPVACVLVVTQVKNTVAAGLSLDATKVNVSISTGGILVIVYIVMAYTVMTKVNVSISTGGVARYRTHIGVADGVPVVRA